MPLEKKINSPQSNIDSKISVRTEDIEEADRIENNLDAMLRLIDFLFFLDDRDDIPS